MYTFLIKKLSIAMLLQNILILQHEIFLKLMEEIVCLIIDVYIQGAKQLEENFCGL